MRVQIHLDYPGYGDEPPATYVKGWEAPWDRLPTLGEEITVSGLTLGRVVQVVWPITDREDPVITLELADMMEKPLQPTRTQLESMGWTWATASRRRDDEDTDRTVASWSRPSRG